MENKTMKHLRHSSSRYVCSECEKHFPNITTSDLTHKIMEVECADCLKERLIKAIRSVSDCAARLANME